jgi:25S rRNA (uracil2634-N3)-methyltransferase
MGGKKRKLTLGRRAHKPADRTHAKGSRKKPAAPGAKSQKQNSDSTPPKQQQQHHHIEPTIPFSAEDKILLVGDGDLSFAASLVEHHYCADVTVTVFEKNPEELLEKYPHAADNIVKIEAEECCRVIFGVDATKMAPFTNKPGRSKASGSEITSADIARPQGVMDRIIFNFPHVGGKSTDVNRQVRYNQELLVSFFQRAIPSLAPGGSIIVTLFEGEPYTLWNIRDLARHSGLQVERSFRFQASAYPGYHHARTLGVVRNRDGEVGGGWKGEDRASRSYVFVKRGAEARSHVAQRGTKRARNQEDDSSDEE